MGPILQLKAQAAQKKYKTDKGKEVETFDDGNSEEDDLTEEEEDKELDRQGLKDKVTKKDKPTDSYDCHGWTFACGQKWINSDQVQKILDDNGYTITNTPQVGDLVVYKDSNGNITHTGIVKEVDKDGKVTKVESKWGRLGRYEHAPNDVPSTYGSPEYYHTNRNNATGKERHTLK
jgi:surface antigen